MNLEDAKEQVRIAEIKQLFAPWRNDPILTYTEELPAAKLVGKISKRLEGLKSRSEALVERRAGFFDRLEETKNALLSRRENLKTERETAAQQWAQAYLRGEDPPPCAMNHLTARLEVALAQKGLRAAEQILYERRDKLEECRKALRLVEQELRDFQEAERLTRQGRDELLKISPLDDEAVGRIEILKEVVRKYEHRRRAFNPAYAGGRLDEAEQILNDQNVSN